MFNLVWITAGILATVFLYYGIPYCYASNSRVWLKRRAVKQNALILTFDDGPGSRMTPAILNLLAEYNIRATFFILGSCIAGREMIVRQIAAEGHDICSHGYRHLHQWKASPFQCLSNIKRGWKAIDTALGVDCGKYAFRPPYGKLNLVTLLYLLIRKAPIILWTFNCGDRTMSKIDAAVLEDNIAQQRAAQLRNVQGAVVLAHDSDRRNPDTEAFTLDSIRAVLAMAKETGMEIMTVSELLNHKK